MQTAKNHSILVVEDNALNLAMLRRFLDKWKMNYQIAGNGKEAVAMVEKGDFDLVLMDLYMPVMDGIEATKILRDRDFKLPVIALSAQMESEKSSQEKLPFTDYIVKPFQPNQLLETISKYLPD